MSVADHTAAIRNRNGLDIDTLRRWVARHRVLEGAENTVEGDWFDPADILYEPCDILIPAALGGVIDADVAREPRC